MSEQHNNQHEGTEPNPTDGLIRVTGLVLTTEEQAELAQLYARFAADRAALARLPLGETEPALTFSVARDAGGAR